VLGSDSALHGTVPFHGRRFLAPALVHRGSSRPPSSRWRPRSSPTTAKSARYCEGRANGEMPWGRGGTPTRCSASVDLHEYLGLPTDEPSINATRLRLGRPVHQGLLEQPARGISETDLNGVFKVERCGGVRGLGGW
jgi:hypothetical protein